MPNKKIREIDKRVNIQIYVTKGYKFKAKIKQDKMPVYEVTINGKDWAEGKAAVHKHRIIPKIRSVILLLQRELNKIDTRPKI